VGAAGPQEDQSGGHAGPARITMSLNRLMSTVPASLLFRS
jgi:hypothetical protein